MDFLGGLGDEAASDAPPSMFAVTAIRPDPEQPRTEFDQERHDNLVASINEMGVLQPLLLRETGSTTRLALEAALRQHGVTPRTELQIGSREAIREAALRGLGIGAVSEAEYVDDPRLRALRIEGDPAFTTTYLYCMSERRESLLVRSFFDVAITTSKTIAT